MKRRLIIGSIDKSKWAKMRYISKEASSRDKKRVTVWQLIDWALEIYLDMNDGFFDSRGDRR